VNGPVICGIEDAKDDRVATVARDLAKRYGLPLFFVHVRHGADAAEGAARLLVEAAAHGDGEVAVESGHPADRLVDLAREQKASFLVVGSHGSRSSLLGSISADVSRRAPCPVVVVPPTVQVAAQAKLRGSDSDGGGGIVRFDVGHALRRMV
jgi:nucleotide-binding universal stress UspA family protein